MEPENNQNPSTKPIGQGMPGTLPIVDDKKFFTHTMGDDVLKAKNQGYVPEKVEDQKPFTQTITPPLPPSSSSQQSDPFREAVDDRSLERDQPFPLDSNMSTEDSGKKFQIYVPQKKHGGSVLTIILILILLMLLGGGGFAYYWFFMKKPVEIPQQVQTPPITPEPVVAQPDVPETPQIPEQTTTPTEQPVVIIETGTTSEPVIIVEPASSTPPVVTQPVPVVETPVVVPVIQEPVATQPLINVDRTVTVIIASLEEKDIYAKIALENAKIAEDKLVIRYLFELSTQTEKRFLNQKETATLLSLTVPSSYWGQSTALEFIGYKNMGSFRYGFVSSVTNKASMQKIASSWEKTVVTDLHRLYIEKAPLLPSVIRFSSNTYLDFTKRYINLPAPDVSLDWAVSSKLFVIATSKDMIFATLDKTKSTQTEQTIPTATTTAPAVPSY